MLPEYEIDRSHIAPAGAAPGARRDKYVRYSHEMTDDTAEASARALGTWEPMGPGNIGGRTRTLIVRPDDPQTMYCGGVSGGVWKTTDGGTSCSGVVTLGVPHDQGKGGEAIDDGPLYDSTQP